MEDLDLSARLERIERMTAEMHESLDDLAEYVGQMLRERAELQAAKDCWHLRLLRRWRGSAG